MSRILGAGVRSTGAAGTDVVHRGPWHDEDRRCSSDEPHDHGIGRSRGGLTTKTHSIVDGRGLPLALGVTPARPVTPRR